jgi:hypothetical protein
MKKLLSQLTLTALSFLPLAAFTEGLQVTEAKLGKGIQDRAIAEESSSFAVNDKVYLVLKLTGGPSDPIKVTWKTGDATDSVTLKVGGNPWRTWSNKTAWKAGDWTVTVTDAGGQVLKELTFKVQ